MFEKIPVSEFATKLDEQDDLTIIDTRTESSFDSWHVPGAINIPFGPTEDLDDDQQESIDADVDGDTIVTICGKGATSTTLAAELDAKGYDDVAVVKGGMRDWNAHYERTTIPTDTDLDIIQFQRRGKGCLSYLITAADTSEAVVVDPTRHTDQYIVAAAEHDATITHVLDTHIHADHISGGPPLADRLDIPYHLGAHADERDPDLTYEPLTGGDTLSVGEFTIDVFDAPGHTSEMVNYRIDDEAIITGDALFLDAVGRTELEFGDTDATRGAALAYETLHDTLFELPESLTVLPAHVGITAEGRYENGSPGEPIAASLTTVRDHLDLLELDRDAFIEELVTDLPEKPANYDTIIARNTGQRNRPSSREATQLETGANNCAT